MRLRELTFELKDPQFLFVTLMQISLAFISQDQLSSECKVFLLKNLNWTLFTTGLLPSWLFSSTIFTLGQKNLESSLIPFSYNPYLIHPETLKSHLKDTLRIWTLLTITAGTPWSETPSFLAWISVITS